MIFYFLFLKILYRIGEILISYSIIQSVFGLFFFCQFFVFLAYFYFLSQFLVDKQIIFFFSSFFFNKLILNVLSRLYIYIYINRHVYMLNLQETSSYIRISIYLSKVPNTINNSFNTQFTQLDKNEKNKSIHNQSTLYGSRLCTID